MKLSRSFWLIALALAVVVGTGAWLKWRSSASAVTPPLATGDTPHIEIARTDITVAAAQRLQQGLPVSGIRIRVQGRSG